MVSDMIIINKCVKRRYMEKPKKYVCKRYKRKRSVKNATLFTWRPIGINSRCRFSQYFIKIQISV